MRNRTGKTIAAACGGAAVVALALGGLGENPAPRIGADPSTTVNPAPPGDCCWASDSALQPMALTLQSEDGGSGCIVGLNCGRVNPTRPPPVTNPPRLAPRQ